ncbi:minor capsid protein [Acinetobacter ursingii]|uniref:Minor capsid protein n=1 Tax=Acinetobacter ursingii TaxID=108980 RepID=A0AA46NVI5_9GAMM|nr:minor capsid protein [Acinetobacter ursingii]UYF76627.1 minor capsid protein [Acinetobacter ursingii]
MNQITQQELFNNLIQHQAYLYRLSSSEIAVLIGQFNNLSNEMLTKLRDLLDELSDTERSALMAGQYTTPTLKEIRSSIQVWQASILSTLPEAFAVSATALAVHEAVYQARVLGEKIKEPNAKTLYSKIRKKPMSGGVLLDYLFDKIADDAKLRVEQVIRDGLSQGQTNQQIVQRIKGKKALNYQDGILEQSRSSIAALTRTARSHVSNQAMIDTYRALDVDWLKTVSTLDSKTCKFCASEDGKVYAIDDPSRPNHPTHPHSRTIFVPLLSKDGKTIGKRPSNSKVGDTGEITTIDSNVKFPKWFDEQSEAFQRDWLGPSRYKLFKQGNYSIEKFVDPLSFQSFTLAELKKMDEKTFKELGL